MKKGLWLFIFVLAAGCSRWPNGPNSPRWVRQPAAQVNRTYLAVGDSGARKVFLGNQGGAFGADGAHRG